MFAALRRRSRWLPLSLVLSLCAAAGEPLPGFHALGGAAPSAECARGYELFLAGQMTEARTAFETAAKNAPEPAALYALGLIAWMDGRDQDATELFGRAVNAAHADPWAEAYLLVLAAQSETCRDAKPFLEALQALQADAAARPRLKDRARAYQAEWLLDRGQVADAAQVYAPLQFLRKWALIGPFDNRDQAGFEKAYGPEEEIEFEKPAPGRNRLVNWFACGAEPLNGVVDLSELFEVNSHSLAYGVTFVKSAEPQWAVLHLGGAGAARVWVNEREAVRIPEYNGFAPEKAAAPVYLHKGWNQVLVKSAVEEEGPWGFAVRLSGLPGGPLPGIETDPGETALKAYRAENPGRNTPLLEPENPDLGLLPRVGAALKASPNEPWLRSWHGYLLAAQRAGRAADRLAAAEYAKAIARCPRSG